MLGLRALPLLPFPFHWVLTYKYEVPNQFSQTITIHTNYYWWPNNVKLEITIFIIIQEKAIWKLLFLILVIKSLWRRYFCSRLSQVRGLADIRLALTHCSHRMLITGYSLTWRSFDAWMLLAMALVSVTPSCTSPMFIMWFFESQRETGIRVLTLDTPGD